VNLTCVGRTNDGKPARNIDEALAGSNATSATFLFTFDVRPTAAQREKLSELNWIRSADFQGGDFRVTCKVRVMPPEIKRLRIGPFSDKLVELMS